MTRFDFSDGHLTIVDAQGHQVELDPLETLELLQLLSDQQIKLPPALLQTPAAKSGDKEQIEIHLQPQHMVHLSVLQAAIPRLQQHKPQGNVFVSPADAVSERAMQLLDAFQIEYKIHPLLDDDNVFAQG